MNTRLSSKEVDACLVLLDRALVLIRAACWSKDVDRAEAIADAFHNLPRLLMERRESWTNEDFDRLFLEGLIEKYPELVGLRDELRARLA
ncbi:MAG: hypothetical protein ACRENE_09980 [Polyangiaceae bacterium]